MALHPNKSDELTDYPCAILWLIHEIPSAPRECPVLQSSLPDYLTFCRDIVRLHRSGFVLLWKEDFVHAKYIILIIRPKMTAVIFLL